MFGYSLGDPQSSVDDVSNPPDSKRILETGLIEGQTYEIWRWGVTRFWFCCSNDDEQQIIRFETKDSSERTSRGVGVGTTLRNLRRKVAREQCSGNSCIVFGPGRTYTTFRLHSKTKRVVQITVSAAGE